MLSQQWLLLFEEVWGPGKSRENFCISQSCNRWSNFMVGVGEWGGGESGAAGLAKGIFKLPVTHARPRHTAAALGVAVTILRNDLAQLLCWVGQSLRPTAPEEPKEGATTLVGQRVKGSKSVATGQTQDPHSVWGPGQTSSSNVAWIFISKSTDLEKNKFWVLQTEPLVWDILSEWRWRLKHSFHTVLRTQAAHRALSQGVGGRGAEKSSGEGAHPRPAPREPADTLPEGTRWEPPPFQYSAQQPWEEVAGWPGPP